MAPSKRFNVAVIGYGMSAKIFHIPLITALSDSFNLYAILQRTPTASNSASSDHPGVKIYNSLDPLLADPAVDVVVVTSIPTAHYEQTLAALRAGKHVVVEKPFVPTEAEARSLCAEATKAGKLLTVYQNRRWDQDFLTVQQLLAEGTLGKVVEFESHYDRYRPVLPPQGERTWKNADLPAGGALYDLGSHLLDQVYCLFGPPESVTGFVGVHKRGLEVGESCPPDHCTALLEYGDAKGERMLVTVKSSSLSAEEEQLRFWIRGTNGSFKKSYLDVQEDQLKAGGTLKDQGFGIEPESHHGTISVAEGSGFKKQKYPSAEPTLYLEYYKLFAQALNGQGEVPVKPESAADVMRIIELAQESSRTGQKMKW